MILLRSPSSAGRALRLLALLALAVASLPLRAADGQTRTLTAIDFSSLEGGRVLMTLTLSAPAPQPTVFATDKPARLAVDLPQTQIALAQRYRKLAIGQVRGVAAVQAQGRTRVVVDLVAPVANTVAVQDDKVLVTLAGPGGSLPPAPGAGTPSVSAPVASITAIDFRRGDRGEGRVLVNLSDSRAAVDVQEQGGKVVARFKNTALPDRLAKRLDVLDFATPVKYIDALRDGPDTLVELTPVNGGDYDELAYQAGGQFVIELDPLSAEKLAQREREHPQFTGQRISLSFQSVDIRSLLQIIADVAGVNMVVSDSIQGQIAMRLQNVPWDQALDVILRVKGLGMRRQGNVMLVAPLEELAQREKVELEAEKQKVQLAPLHSELIQINYAKASELASLIRSKESSILSDRGSVTVDERTNSLLVLDTADKLADIRALIQRLDVPVRQVLIESRIVIAQDNFERDLGTRFGITQAGTSSNGNLFTTSGTSTSTNNTVTGYLNSGRTTIGIDPTPSDRYNINLPAPVATGSTPASIAFALLGKNVLVDLELQALQTEGQGEVISTPRVITANGKQAAIKQGVEIPYQQSTSSGATSVSFKDAVLSLNVTPQITPDGRIIMDLAVHDDSVGQNVSTGTGGSVPSINTREVDTQVLVDNGQTVVLGGVYQQTVNKNVSKVPLLGDLPLLGFLFRNTQLQNQKQELLIFITPKILTGELNAQ
ncbi:MAG: type IV pilus secretin PilQ [Sinobacteraceae bacterium]|nr:type IV pilus secretin PilQ [Nevskiaceae bacterium]